MSDEFLIDQFLDAWEEQLESKAPLSLEQFIKERLEGTASELVEAFRHQAEELASIDRQIEQIAGPVGTVNQSPNWNGESLRLSALQPGLEPISGYSLVSRLGGGGFGEVWKAESPGGFHVALKFVPVGGRVGEIEERSLEIIKDVRHPHLLSVFGTWRIGDLLVIATELADRTLLDRFHESQKEGHEGIPKDELFVYLAEAAKGIDFLNDPGKSGRMRIQHRDIKPQNLLLSGGSVKVGDFGLARSIQYDVTGHTGSLTFAYAAPECFDGTTSNCSDQYSLAVSYCHLRGGRLPFEGTQVEIMEGHRKKQPDLSMVPADERPAIAKALAKRPKDRWNSCTEFVRHLGLSEPIGTTPAVQTVAGLRARFNRLFLFVTAIVIVIVLSVTWLVNQRYSSQSTSPDSIDENSQSFRVVQATPEVTPRPRIAVLYFENQSPDDNRLAPLAKGLCSMMITRLDAKYKYDIVERERIEAVLDELELARSGIFDQRDVAQIGHLLGARQLVLGSYFQLFNVFRIDARVVDVETGKTMAAAGVEGSPGDFSSLLSKLVEQLVQKQHQPENAQPENETACLVVDNETVPQISVRAVLDLGRAVDAFDRGDTATAITTVKTILESDSSFEDAKRLLSDWTAPTANPEDRPSNEK
ncbi:MAG: hypothetical protein CME33_09430 [Gimesia sp.]|uniref:serine/threonine-protein kinase n=1 Tax=Gimesia sp. TaxID=2024833 RepID=UPI000C483ECA|nr:serine/threonine-protein kinase [Gimesia sp.]MAX36771.1 hypothetical protein [Gimesia sp.]